MEKRHLLRKLGLALMIGMLGAGLAACEEEGPAEQAGESIDESVEEMGEGVEEMGDDLEQAAEDAQN